MSDLYFNKELELQSSRYGYIAFMYEDLEESGTSEKRWIVEYSESYDSRMDIFNGSIEDVKEFVISDFKQFLQNKIDEFTDMLKHFES